MTTEYYKQVFNNFMNLTIYKNYRSIFSITVDHWSQIYNYYSPCVTGSGGCHITVCNQSC